MGSGRLTRIWPRCLGSDRAGLVYWVERREEEEARMPKEGGREGEAAMIPMCADWVGKGCSMQSSTERLNSNPCAPHEAREARDFLRASRGWRGKGLPSPSKSSIRSTDGPQQDLCPFTVPLSYAGSPGPYGVASTTHRSAFTVTKLFTRPW
jgi:hypothetical protein